VAGQDGFNIAADGDAEFNNIIVRGTLEAAVFAFHAVRAEAGSLIVSVSAGKLLNDVTTVASPTTFDVDIEDPAYGHVQLFSVDDILRLTRTDGAENWITVSSVSDQTTFYRYVCTLSDGSPAMFYAGTPVIDYGQSGDGFLFLTADDTNGPFYSVRTHAGAPWSAVAELTRLGKLDGNWGYAAASDTFGLALGEYGAAKANLVWDPVEGLRLRTHSTTVIQLDQSGNADITGKLRMPGISSAIAIGVTPPTGPAAGTGIWLDRTGFFALAAGTYQVKIDAATGKLYAGGGVVTLEENGIGIEAPAGMARENYVQWDLAAGGFRSRVGGDNAGTLFVQALTALDLGLYDPSGPFITQLLYLTADGVSADNADWDFGQDVCIDGKLCLAANAWRLGGVVLDLDFTGTAYNTKAKCQAVGLRFSDADTPFPSPLRYTVSGSWSHSAGNGWQPAAPTDDQGPAILVPLSRGGNWEVEVGFYYSPATAALRGRLLVGYTCGSSHLGAFGQVNDASAGAKELKWLLLTNDGDDTYSTPHIGTVLPNPSGSYKIKFRSLRGCVSVYDDQDDAWHDYVARQSAGIAYTPAGAFLQALKAGTSTFWTVYLESLKLTYLL